MAIKGIVHITGHATVSDGQVIVPVYVAMLDGSNSSDIEYGPVAASQVTDANITAWAKNWMNEYYSASLSILDTVKLIVGTGGIF